MSNDAVPLNENALVPFRFQGISLQESCWIGGMPYATAEAIGKFLEYAYPGKTVRKIVERNPHTDDPRWATDVILTSVEGGREVRRKVRVYGPIAIQLIINKSNQPKAIAFQVAAANLVWACMTGELKPPKLLLLPGLLAAAQQIYSMWPGPAREAAIRDLTEREVWCKETTYRQLKRFMDRPLPRVPDISAALRARCLSLILMPARQRRREIRRLAAEWSCSEGTARRRIEKITGQKLLSSKGQPISRPNRRPSKCTPEYKREYMRQWRAKKQAARLEQAP